jgi:hypothetical protein
MGKHRKFCKCSIYPEGHMIAKADKFKHHLELQQVRIPFSIVLRLCQSFLQ